jgi:lipopolysaccharide transport system ATP-binding protein
MSDIVLKVEHLYKRYRLGNVDRQAFKEDIISFWHKMRGLPDPYETYTTSNELAAAKSAEEVKSRYVWSLQDVNFEVKKGEVVGIIGKNGAGKSTLLKILSKTTTPTKGKVKIKGRIASLLEVGTGFHPDLTGRENIYMNGAILGMTRHEITAKLDEIVAFAGIEAFIDTPVKRYSSGMYVRLAFAVAAHLEPDILIVDEVLAVGDADFQKKCIGKMKDVSQGEGRTVLFVSHNMNVINNLCTKAFFLQNGKCIYDGNIKQAVSYYLGLDKNNGVTHWQLTNLLKLDCYFTTVKLENEDGSLLVEGYDVNNKHKVFLVLDFVAQSEVSSLHLVYHVRKTDGTIVYSSYYIDKANDYLRLKKGKYQVRVELPTWLLNPNHYLLEAYIGNEYSGHTHSDTFLSFHVTDVYTNIAHNREGFIYCPQDWRVMPI